MSFLSPHTVARITNSNRSPATVPGISLTPEADPAVIRIAGTADAAARARLAAGGFSINRTDKSHRG